MGTVGKLLTGGQCEAEFPISRRHRVLFGRGAVGVGNQRALSVQAFKQWLALVLYRGVSKLDVFNAQPYCLLKIIFI